MSMTLTALAAWYRAIGLATAAFGLAFALGAWPPLAGPTRIFADLVFWPLDGAETLDAPAARLFAAVSGGLTVAFGLILWLLGREGFVQAPALSRRLVLLMSFGWCAVDSTGSLLAGSPANVLANLALLALFTGPLLRAEPQVA
jgi:hypothetical protein